MEDIDHTNITANLSLFGGEDFKMSSSIVALFFPINLGYYTLKLNW